MNNEERLQVLDMLARGKITTEDASMLLVALDEQAAAAAPAESKASRWAAPVAPIPPIPPTPPTRPTPPTPPTRPGRERDRERHRDRRTHVAAEYAAAMKAA